MKKRKVDRPKTPRETQTAELRRRRANWQEARSEKPVDAQPFVRAKIPASATHFCWFCFECDRELLVAGTTGVQFCRECACSLLELATQYVPDQDELIGPLVNACAAALPIAEAASNRPVAAQLKYAVKLTAEWLNLGPCDDPAWTEEDAAECEPRQPELPLEEGAPTAGGA